MKGLKNVKYIHFQGWLEKIIQPNLSNEKISASSIDKMLPHNVKFVTEVRGHQ